MLDPGELVLELELTQPPVDGGLERGAPAGGASIVELPDQEAPAGQQALERTEVGRRLLDR